MNTEKIVISDSLFLVVDDLGWFCPIDDRASGGPSRTGMSRWHTAEDYEVINELGRRLNMKIACAFVMGEWDPDNRLAKIPYLSKYGSDWDNAAHIDIELARKCAEVINKSEYIDLNVHGLLHGNYRDGVTSVDVSDYFYPTAEGLFRTEESEIRARLDAFFDILNYYGIKKKINAFVPPSFAYRLGSMSHILADYGIEYVSTIFNSLRRYHTDGREIAPVCEMDGDIITVDRNNNLVPWDKENADPTNLPVVSGIFGSHWPNFLHADPAHQSELTEKWVKYFEKCSEQFGIVLSREISIAATQSLYTRFAEVSYAEGKMQIDISNVPKAKGRLDFFYISSKEPIKTFSGCEIEVFEQKSSFINYKVTPQSDVLVIE